MVVARNWISVRYLSFQYNLTIMKRSKIKHTKSKSIYRTFVWLKMNVLENKYLLLKWLWKCICCWCILSIDSFWMFRSRWKQQYRFQCKECKSDIDKEYRKNNKDRCSINKSLYYKNNRSKILDYYKEKYHTNQERRNMVLQRTKDWVKYNPEWYRVIQQRMRVKRKYWKSLMDDWTINKQSIIDLLKKQDYKCVMCMCDIKEWYTLDHCKSLSDWWTHSIKNIQMMCKSCNSKKNKKSFRIINWVYIYL